MKAEFDATTPDELKDAKMAHLGEGSAAAAAKEAKAATTAAAAEAEEAQVRKTPSWPRSWANFSLL